VPSSAGTYFDFLDGVRGIAILLVVLCHAVYCNPTATSTVQFFRQVTGAGTIGVPIFFVLSGFVIFHPFYKLREKDSCAWVLPGYARRRILKIAPPFLMSLALLSGLYLVQFRDLSYISEGLEWFVGLPNHSLRSLASNRFNGPLWSLVVEVQFYFILPFLLLATRGLSARQTTYAIGGILIVIPMLIRSLTLPAAYDPLLSVLLERRFPCHLDYFGWGILFCGIFNSPGHHIHARKSWAWAGYIGLYGIIPTMFLIAWLGPLMNHHPLIRTEIYHGLTSIVAFMILFFIFNTDSKGVCFLSSPLLRFTGLISYEWYLLHEPAIFFSRWWFGSAQSSPLRYAAILSLPLFSTFLISALIYQFYSIPIIKFGRSKIHRNRQDLKTA